MGASSLASSMGTRSGGIESGMIEPQGSLARGGVPSREEMTSPLSVVSTKPWWTRFESWKRQYFIQSRTNLPQSPQSPQGIPINNQQLFLHRSGHQELLMHLVVLQVF